MCSFSFVKLAKIQFQAAKRSESVWSTGLKSQCPADEKDAFFMACATMMLHCKHNEIKLESFWLGCLVFMGGPFKEWS